VRGRHHEERSDAVIQAVSHMDCFALLAMTEVRGRHHEERSDAVIQAVSG
jgi:hypothetical protein